MVRLSYVRPSLPLRKRLMLETDTPDSVESLAAFIWDASRAAAMASRRSLYTW